jgi:hypothetical protein
MAGFEFVPTDYRYIKAIRRDGTGEPATQRNSTK